MVNQTDLEWATSEELIDELMRRETFAGVIIRPAGGVIQEHFDKSQFKMSIRNITVDDATDILHNALASLEGV